MMRLRFDLGALDCHSTPQKLMLALPPALTLVSDLVHHLHRRLLLPPCSVTLAVDYFSLLPAFRIEDVLRDGDVIQVWPANVASPSKRRKITKRKPDMLALLDGSPEVSMPSCTRAASSKAKRAPALLALPSTSDMLQRTPIAPASLSTVDVSHISDEQPAAAQSNENASLSREDGGGDHGRSGKHKKKLKCSFGIPVFPSNRCLDFGGAIGTDQSNNVADGEPLQEILPPPAALLDGGARALWESKGGSIGSEIGAGGVAAKHEMPELPDPMRHDLWKAIARTPFPGEIIRFRRAIVNGEHVGAPALSAFQVAWCYAVGNSSDGPVCRLLQSDADDWILTSDLLQVSIQRSQCSLAKSSAKSPSRGHSSGAAVNPDMQPQVAVPVEAKSQAGGSSSSEECPQTISESAVVTPRCEERVSNEAPCGVATGVRQESRRRIPYKDQAPSQHQILYESMANGTITEASAQEQLEKLRRAVKRQVDFYFGEASYPQDNFLQSQADYDGWTDLTLVAKFNRMRGFTRDYQFVVDCLQMSDVVEVSDCGFYVRRRHGIR